MKYGYLKLCAAVGAVALAAPLLAQTSGASQPQELPQVVSYELGDSEFAAGDSITIQEVRGTNGKIEPGGTYSVTGTYTLNSQSAADLSFFATTTNRAATPIAPEQTVRVTQGTGSFRLVKQMNEEGYLHLSFYSRSTGQAFGGVYFGQGQWVLHKKHFRYSSSPSQKAESSAPLSLAGPNKVLFEYLGNSVSPPENLDAAYTKDGLTHGMQEAARTAGISLVKVEIDDSEFPFLVGVVTASGEDMERFKEQIRKAAAYHFSGGIGGNTTYTMNVVPSEVFPAEARQRIYHRMMLREAILSDKINGYER